MNILIDTNILLYILFGNEKLKVNELNLIESSNNEIIISSISILEISIKYSIGKLELNNISPDKIPEILEKHGYFIENMDYKTFSSFYKLPLDIHKDPFDRLLIWEAIRKEYYLLSRDKLFKEYEKFGLKLLM